MGADGALTGFGGGLVIKERLLLHEGWDDASKQRERTESRAGFRLTRRERGLRPRIGVID